MEIIRALKPTIFLALGLIVARSAATPSPTPFPSATPQATVRIPTASINRSSTSGDTVELVMVSGKNQARYRVREQLAGVALPSDAIGSTDQVSGTIVGKIDGTIISSQSKFTVDMRTLKSDQNARDDFIRRTTLQTDRYPYATFVPTQAPGLPLTLPASGDLNFKLIGDLTIRDMTKSVTWDVQGKVLNDEATGSAKTNFNFAYFNLTIPSVARVLSIVDNIQLELDLDLKRVP